MSAGAFIISTYQATYLATAIHPIRIQPETLAAQIGATANAAPTGAQTNPISAKVSLGNTELGLKPRTVVLRASNVAAEVPDGYQPGGITRVPALTPAFHALAVKGAVCSYLGQDWTVVSNPPERTN